MEDDSNMDRINIPVEFDFEEIKAIVLKAIRDDDYFSQLETAPHATLREDSAFFSGLDDSVDLTGLIATLDRARELFRTRPGDLSFLDEIVHITGTIAESKTEKGRQTDFSNKRQTEVKYEQATDTSKGSEKSKTTEKNVMSSKNFAEQAGKGKAYGGLSLSLTLDFGPLLSQEVMKLLDGRA